MKYMQGELTEADLRERQRFWNKRGFFRNVVWVTTRLDGSPREVCFLHGGKIRTGWVLGVNEDNDNELAARSNVAGAYTNTEGYKTVSVPIENIVILSDY